MARSKPFGTITTVLSTLSLCVGIPSLAVAETPSFNCTKTLPAAESLICQDAKLSRLDRDLAQSYKNVNQRLDAEGKAALLEEQRTFLYARDRLAEEIKSSNQASKSSLGQLMRQHLSSLQHIKPRQQASDIMGSWFVTSGGVDINKRDANTLSLHLNRVEPTRGNWVCDFQGTAQATDAQAKHLVFHSNDDPQQQLLIERVGSILRVSTPQGNGTDYCGLNGTVNGDYLPLRSK